LLKKKEAGIRTTRRGTRKRWRRLHGDGVFGVADDVPARTDSGVGKERAGAGEVLFGFLRVKLVFDFVVFEWNGEKAKAVDAAGGGARSGIVHAELKPKRVAKIDEQKQGERREEDAARDMAEGRRGIGESGW